MIAANERGVRTHLRIAPIGIGDSSGLNCGGAGWAYSDCLEATLLKARTIPGDFSGSPGELLSERTDPAHVVGSTTYSRSSTGSSYSPRPASADFSRYSVSGCRSKKIRTLSISYQVDLRHSHCHRRFRGTRYLSFVLTLMRCLPEVRVKLLESWSPHLTYRFFPSIQTCSWFTPAGGITRSPPPHRRSYRRTIFDSANLSARFANWAEDNSSSLPSGVQQPRRCTSR